MAEAKKGQNKNPNKKPSRGIAVAALLMNILILPGLGSLIAGKVGVGAVQLGLSVISAVLFAAGIVFSFLSSGIGIVLLVIGTLLGLAMWTWGLVTGIRLVKEAETES